MAYIFAFAARFSESGGHEGGGGLLSVNPGLAFWTVLTFVLLLIILRKVAWKPILTALDEREKNIQDSLELAETARKEASEKLEENKIIIAQAHEEARKLLAESRQFAEDMKQRMLDDGKVAADKKIADALQEIENKKREASAELKNLTVELSVEIAEKIIRKSLDPAAQKQMVDEYIKAIQKN